MFLCIIVLPTTLHKVISCRKQETSSGIVLQACSPPAHLENLSIKKLLKLLNVTNLKIPVAVHCLQDGADLVPGAMTIIRSASLRTTYKTCEIVLIFFLLPFGRLF